MKREQPDIEELEIRKKAIRLGENLWGSYIWLSPIAKQGDYILPLRLTKMSENVYVLTFKLIKVNNEEVILNE